MDDLQIILEPVTISRDVQDVSKFLILFLWRLQGFEPTTLAANVFNESCFQLGSITAENRGDGGGGGGGRSGGVGGGGGLGGNVTELRKIFANHSFVPSYSWRDGGNQAER